MRAWTLQRLPLVLPLHRVDYTSICCWWWCDTFGFAVSIREHNVTLWIFLCLKIVPSVAILFSLQDATSLHPHWHWPDLLPLLPDGAFITSVVVYCYFCIQVAHDEEYDVGWCRRSLLANHHRCLLYILLVHNKPWHWVLQSPSSIWLWWFSRWWFSILANVCGPLWWWWSQHLCYDGSPFFPSRVCDGRLVVYTVHFLFILFHVHLVPRSSSVSSAFKSFPVC